MLKVVKIIEGGIDLETQEELPRSLIVSNGRREVTVPANDNVIREVVELLAEMVDAPLDVSMEAKMRVNSQPVSGSTTPRPPPSPRPVSKSPSPFESDEERGSQTPFDDEGFEPGEEFNDGGTGAGSL